MASRKKISNSLGTKTSYKRGTTSIRSRCATKQGSVTKNMKKLVLL